MLRCLRIPRFYACHQCRFLVSEQAGALVSSSFSQLFQRWIYFVQKEEMLFLSWHLQIILCIDLFLKLCVNAPIYDAVEFLLNFAFALLFFLVNFSEYLPICL